MFTSTHARNYSARAVSHRGALGGHDICARRTRRRAARLCVSTARCDLPAAVAHRLGHSWLAVLYRMVDLVLPASIYQSQSQVGRRSVVRVPGAESAGILLLLRLQFGAVLERVGARRVRARPRWRLAERAVQRRLLRAARGAVDVRDSVADLRVRQGRSERRALVLARARRAARVDCRRRRRRGIESGGVFVARLYRLFVVRQARHHPHQVHTASGAQLQAARDCRLEVRVCSGGSAYECHDFIIVVLRL